MGGITSRDAGEEEVDTASTNAYRYPPKNGNYFGSCFYMGGERFEMSQPEAYLFGENSDLNFLGNKPIPFPYQGSTSGSEPTKPLKSLVNIRKDSLKFVKVDDNDEGSEGEKSDSMNTRYNIEFTFDSDSKCAITIYYFATEDVSNGQITFQTRESSLNSEVFHYKRGANQLFSQTTHILDPSKFTDEEWQYDPIKDTIPVVISCVVEDEDHPCHCHMTYAVVEKSSVDGSYMIKALKQKQFVDGLLYLLQEIYGIENKQIDRSKLEDPDDEVEDSGAECVICMSDMRDTLILPCRHLCLCSNCAESLRYQASSCPICRSPFRALLQIRAMRKKQPLSVQTGETGEENPVSQEGVPTGYEAVSLIEAVNGPCNQLFTVDGGLQLPLRTVAPGDTDSSYREKKRLSKRHVISVKPEDPVVNPSVRPDDKKVLDEEEEERKKDVPVEVVKMERKSSKKEAIKSQYTEDKDMSDELNASKIVTVSEDYNTDSLDSKGMRPATLRVYESEADSDYDLKPIALNQGQTSTENLADDEREDSSETEPEPEPDYDDDVSTEAVKSESTPNVSHDPGLTNYEEQGVTYVKGLSLSMNDMNRDNSGYHPLCLQSDASLPEHSTSGTEASSFGSTYSSGKLLLDNAESTD
ncbi:E3 ubiquitin-protein ligase MGRN1-like isoform X4 [Ostrea edulis]|uniref:E3 ubiquitin-protein ligase MGRN1-like isoform X4 n=1 Tax=Ostrea edulis TaxID=37623 RepID=UPI002095F43D|nr:E3 ubiquitin-protein ligase MGRN1-like isoform X4 [Ostrea edulis]